MFYKIQFYVLYCINLLKFKKRKKEKFKKQKDLIFWQETNLKHEKQEVFLEIGNYLNLATIINKIRKLY